GLGRQPPRQRRNQRMLFDAPLELPDAEADKGRNHGEREQAEAKLPPSCHLTHFCSRSIKRPGAALWWNCSAISSDFIDRNGNSVVTRMSGSQSTACSQNGG